MNNDNHISCAEHGDAHATFVCKHIIKNPSQQWFSDFPSENKPWPDAWCAKCDDEYLKEGEWNEKSEPCLEIKIFCSHCYEIAIAKSVDALSGEALESWVDTVSECHDELSVKHQQLEVDFSLSKYARWDYDQARNLLIFSNDGLPSVFADIEFIGSISTISNTWLWSWANFHNLANVRTRIKSVRAFGEEYGFPKLTVPKWSGEQIDGWEVSGIATRVLGAHGVYRVPTENGFLFMAIMNIEIAH